MSAVTIQSRQPNDPFASTQAWSGDYPLHGFLDRDGGVSCGPYASMNLASWTGDDPGAVEENWRRWHHAFAGLHPVYLNQVHGNSVVTVCADTPTRLPADGMVTADPGIALCIFTADCVPVLMVDRAHGIIGALHAGWRGTLAAIAADGVRAMAALGAHPDRIEVALGPAIGICCFEVNQTLAERFASEIPAAARHARAGKPGKAYLDLRGIITDQLIAMNVVAAKISQVGPCTRCAGDRFFSRRAAGGRITGLQMSFVGYPA